ncbi:carbon monoxide dehydrogenase subunit G [Frigidibacter sp. SD6-1]|uniref:CoxG family protein n=1 Tax=Frigidibacter sp. SD6-1 TaxID=3032581 RepID=UPI0024DF5CA8|nr:carbon monoxide dehydrogenase subunit G [Frigidibacter sp. SD6-1]
MQLTDDRLIRADTDTVWRAILDPEVLKACIPGCENLTGSPEAGYEAVVAQKIGPVSARFAGVVSLSDLRPGEGLTLSGEGKGGAAGFAKGSAQVSFAAEGDATRLTYTVDANVGGKIAQLGSRLIDSFAKKLADQFFERFQAAVEGPGEAAEEELAEVDGDATAEKKGWFKRLVGG